jgi:hypothetical protein
MWLLAFAFFLQTPVILELVLNRLIAVVWNSRRTPMRKLADGSFCGSLLALVMSVLTIPVSIASAAAQLFVSYLSFWLSLTRSPLTSLDGGRKRSGDMMLAFYYLDLAQ